MRADYNRRNETEEKQKQRRVRDNLRHTKSTYDAIGDEILIGDEFDDVYLNGRPSSEPNDTDFYDHYKRLL